MEKSNTESSFESTQEFFDFWLNTHQSTLGMLAKMPALGPAREKFEKQMKGFSDVVNLYMAWMESQIVLMEAMRKVREKTAAIMTGDISPEQYKDFYKIWMETYSETFHEFLKSGQSNTGSSFESTQEFFDFWLNTHQSTLGMLAKMPALGPAREKFEKQMKGFSDVVNLYMAWMESQIVLMEACARCVKRQQPR